MVTIRLLDIENKLKNSFQFFLCKEIWKGKQKYISFFLAPLSVYKVRQMFVDRDDNDCRQKNCVGWTWLLDSMDNHESNTRQTKVTVYLMSWQFISWANLASQHQYKVVSFFFSVKLSPSERLNIHSKGDLVHQTAKENNLYRTVT